MSRTSTWTWKQIRTAAITQATAQGITNCPLCRTWLDYEHQGLPNSPEVDHIIPHAQGGLDDINNTRVICRTCNRRLGGKHGNAKQRQNQAMKTFQPKTPKTSFNW